MEDKIIELAYNALAILIPLLVATAAEYNDTPGSSHQVPGVFYF